MNEERSIVRYTRENFPRGQRVVVSSSSLVGEGIVLSIKYLYPFPLVHVRMDDGRKIWVPVIALAPTQPRR